jgi:transposase
MTERELERRAQRRLAVLRHVEEVSGNVAATCRYYGISRQCYYGWSRRYEADALEGLKDRSNRPHRSPRITQAEVIEKIVWLRKHYHFGPAMIAMYLARYHDVTISTSGVWRILKRLGMNRLPASKRHQRRALRWKRYEKQRPGHQLQVDVKFLEPVGQRRCAQKVLTIHRHRPELNSTARRAAHSLAASGPARVLHAPGAHADPQCRRPHLPGAGEAESDHEGHPTPRAGGCGTRGCWTEEPAQPRPDRSESLAFAPERGRWCPASPGRWFGEQIGCRCRNLPCRCPR